MLSVACSVIVGALSATDHVEQTVIKRTTAGSCTHRHWMWKNNHVRLASPSLLLPRVSHNLKRGRKRGNVISGSTGTSIMRNKLILSLIRCFESLLQMRKQEVSRIHPGLPLSVFPIQRIEALKTKMMKKITSSW